MRLKAIVLVVLVLVTGFSSRDPGSEARAQEADPLVTDGLDALDVLVSQDGDHCALHDAADDDAANGAELPFVLCDDGAPPSGGGSNGIPVPAKYTSAGGNDWKGLPAPATAEETAEADAQDDLQPDEGNRITLDVNVTLPPSKGIATEYADQDWPVRKRPAEGWPVIVLMHGCCGGNKTSWQAPTIDAEREHWHHSNAWFAARGYVVVTYTARGFRNQNDEGSTGTTQLDSRRYEINDYQYLVGLLADHDARRRAAGDKPIFDINPRKVAAVGGSYGGGFSWLAVTDPRWRSLASGTAIRLAAAVPKYGWTDLVEALVPGGHYFDLDPEALPEKRRTAVAPVDPAKAVSRSPVGVEKQSIVAGLYATGNSPAGNHTTFPAWMHDVYARLQLGEPYEGDPDIEAALDTFLADRSAYYQQAFWKRVRKGLRVPIYAPATWTDPLFPTMETVRFYNKLKQVQPKYPIALYLGDYQHFVANKAKEWGDLCGEDHHVCTSDDFRSDSGRLTLGKAPARVRRGINTRINRFLDHHLRGKGTKPPSDVTATTTICAANATERYKVDEPGAEFRAATWRKLAPKAQVFGWEGGGTVASVAVDGHASESDPVFRDRASDKCFTTSSAPGMGVAQFTTEPLARTMTLMGLPMVTLEYDTTAENYWIAARLFDKDEEGNMTMVTRGLCRVNKEVDEERLCEVFELFGNGWILKKGHSVVLEVTQSDSPFLRKSNEPSTLTITSANIRLPLTRNRLRTDFRR
ncbi:MAG TPA: CocE/NonD family hydrolase C-terminal non-catalytic domain-containing protein [Actinomycetota bacterium]|nr:CocE/NonD family hydrolase C-terminal non-catalytic domain-containing protein [Actinomycetota bacterium]